MLVSACASVFLSPTCRASAIARDPVPADPRAGAERLGDRRLVPHRGRGELERSGQEERVLLVDQGERLDLVQVVARGLRVVADVPAGGLTAQPLRHVPLPGAGAPGQLGGRARADRKSTRLNSSHPSISYAVFCLKKKK